MMEDPNIALRKVWIRPKQTQDFYNKLFRRLQDPILFWNKEEANGIQFITLRGPRLAVNVAFTALENELKKENVGFDFFEPLKLCETVSKSVHVKQRVQSTPPVELKVEPLDDALWTKMQAGAFKQHQQDEIPELLQHDFGWPKAEAEKVIYFTASNCVVDLRDDRPSIPSAFWDKIFKTGVYVGNVTCVKMTIISGVRANKGSELVVKSAILHAGFTFLEQIMEIKLVRCPEVYALLEQFGEYSSEEGDIITGLVPLYNEHRIQRWIYSSSVSCWKSVTGDFQQEGTRANTLLMKYLDSTASTTALKPMKDLMAAVTLV